MGRIDDPFDGELTELKRRLAQLESRSPLSNSAVSGGRTRFIGEDSFRIEGSGSVSGTLTIDGLEVVDGELHISGRIEVTGSARFEGPMTIAGKTTIAGDTSITGDTTVTGDFHVKGPATIDGTTVITGDTTVEGPFRVRGPMGVYGALGIHGNTTIDGSLSIDGDTTLSGDLNVDDTGHIDVGDMRIGKSGGRGKVDFGTGELASDGTKVAMQSGSALAGVGGGIAQLTLGGNGFRVDSGGVRIGDLPTSDRAPNLYLDSNNKLWRTTGSSGGGTSV